MIKEEILEEGQNSFVVGIDELNNLFKNERVVPIHFIGNEPSEDAIDLYGAWFAHMNLKWDKTLSPWVPVGKMGAIPIIGHYNWTDCKVNFPLEIAQKTILTKKDYFNILDRVDFSKRQPSVWRMSSESKNINKHFKKPFFHGKNEFLEYILASMPLTEGLRVALKNLNPDDSWENWPDGFREVYLFYSHGQNIIDLKHVHIERDLVGFIPEALARSYNCIPFLKIGKALFVSTDKHPNVSLSDLLLSRLKGEISCINFCVSSLKNISEKTQILRKQATRQESYNLHDSEEKTKNSNSGITIDEIKIASLNIEKGRLPSEDLLKRVLLEAVQRDASDIHIEQCNDRGRIRFRIDGDLRIFMEPSLEQTRALVTVAKNACSMSANTFDNEDASISVRIGNQKIGLRCNVTPFRRSFQKMVLRLLRQSNEVIKLGDLDISAHNVSKLKHAIHQSQGLILITGPTGEGKTTTLYSALAEINSETKNIQTIEDPIEKEIDGLNQTAVDLKRDITFSSIMRSIVRQDPNVILLGEIRDRESAELAVQAADTGHLVLSTLHSNSAIKTIQRLFQLGVERGMLADSLILLQAQRLLKKLCMSCRHEISIDQETKIKLIKLGISNPFRLYEKKGCLHCANTGYNGRIVAMETIPVDEELAQMIANGASTFDIKKHANLAGNLTLYEDALLKVGEGKTCLVEANRLKAAWV